MQMLKKSAALVLSVLMLLSMFTVAAGMTAFAADSYKVTATTSQGVFADTSKTYKAGDEFDLNIYLKADDLLSDGQLDVKFDPTALYATKITKGGNLNGEAVSFVGAGAGNQRYQTRYSCVAINFTCSIDAADYSTTSLLFTVHFQVKSDIAADQSIDVDFTEVSGIEDEFDINTKVPYIRANSVIDANKSRFTVTAELTGGSEPSPQPTTAAPTEAPTTAAPTVAPTTQTPTTVAPTTAAPAKSSYYVVGNMTSWGVNDSYNMTKNTAADAEEYMFTINLDTTSQFKIVKSEGGSNTWYPDGMGNNYGENGEITEAGTYTVYFRPNKDGGDDWFYNMIYVAKEDTQPTTEAPEPTTAAPQPTTKPSSATYYLFGYINGADYACEADAANMGDYKFVNGKVTAKFDQTSYVAVKEEGNANWYMTNGWQGEVSSATLYNTTGLGTDANKLYVPGGVEVTFTLVENADGTLTLSYAAKEEPTTEAPEPTTAAPQPTTAAPQPTTAAPQPTTAAPQPTTAAPQPTTAAPQPTTAAPEPTTAAPTPETYTFYYLPSADQEAAGNTYKLNFNDPNGSNPDNWHQYTFTQTPITVDGVHLYSVSVPKDFDDVTELQYQVYDGDTWLSQNKFDNVKLSDYDNKVVKSDGTIEPEQPTVAPTTAEPEQTTAAPEPTTAEPEQTTAAPEPTTAEPEQTTAAPEPTTAEPEPTTAEPEPTTAEPTTAQPTTVEPTTAEPTVAPTTAEPTVAPTTAAPTIAPKKVDFSKNPDEASAVNAIAKATSDSDPKGSKFSGLKAKVAKTTKNSNKITWSKVKGAKKYIVMGNKCGKTNGKFNAFKKLKTTTGKSFTQKGLKKNTYYKYVVLAVNAKGKVISASKVMHVATKGGKNTNYKSLKLNKTSKTLKKGKTFKLKVTKKTKMNKKGKVKNHRKIKYESSNTKIVTVNAKGKIKAKKKGTAYVYAYAQNGVYKRIKIKVK